MKALMNSTVSSHHGLQITASPFPSPLGKRGFGDEPLRPQSRPAQGIRGLMPLAWVRDIPKLPWDTGALPLLFWSHIGEISAATAVSIHNFHSFNPDHSPWPNIYCSCIILKLFCRGGRSSFWKTLEHSYINTHSGCCAFGQINKCN